MESIALRIVCGLLVLGACACGDDSGGPSDADSDADGTEDGNPACEGCWIGGTCHDADEVNASDPCLVCDPAQSGTAWSDNDGATCDDGDYCNGADTCVAGACDAHAGDPCTDDGVFCNGAESCNEVIDTCLHDEDACPDDGAFCNGAETCDETADSCGHAGDPCAGGTCFDDEARCCTPEARRGCNAAGDAAWFDSCGHAGEIVETCSHAPDALCRAGVCGCIPGWTGADCDVCVRFVDAATGDDAGLGTTWANAKATVQAAIDSAEADGCEVWIKAGTYVTTDTTDHDISFVMTPGLALRGGFAGTEISPAERDLAANVTVLSGEIGVAGEPTDNSHIVIQGADGGVLDGVTVSGAYARRAEWYQPAGGGLRVDGVAMTVHRCVFEGNFGGASDAAGTSLGVSNGTVTVEDSVFRNNTTYSWGAGVYVEMRDGAVAGAVVRRCRFENNTAGGAGAVAFFMYYGSAPGTLEVENCVFTGNAGGGLAAFSYGDATDGTPLQISVRNSTFVDNEADSEGGGLMLYPLFGGPARLDVTNCIVWGNRAPVSPQIRGATSVTYSDVEGAGYDGTDGNLSLDPLFVNGDPDAGPLDLHLQAGSPCIDAGNDTVAPARDFEDLPRYDDPATPNCATPGTPECDWFSDLGAYEYQD